MNEQAKAENALTEIAVLAKPPVTTLLMKHIPSDAASHSGIIARQQARRVSCLRLTEEGVLGEHHR